MCGWKMFSLMPIHGDLDQKCKAELDNNNLKGFSKNRFNQAFFEYSLGWMGETVGRSQSPTGILEQK